MKAAPLSIGLTTLLLFPACQSRFSAPLVPEDAVAIAALQQQIAAIPDVEQPPSPYAEDSYEFFVSHLYYLETMVAYRNEELLAKATANCPVYICLSQQRGRLYVDGQVALDWPVSTGTEDRPTSVGRFAILEKKEEHFSGRFGVIYDSEDNVVEAEADSRLHKVPEGGRWEGASMPNWMRLTHSGIGMHTGMVVPGERLSHGCIRMPHEISTLLFSVLQLKSRVYVADEVEDCFPCKVALNEGDKLRVGRLAKRALTRKLVDLSIDAEERARQAEEARERAEAEAEARREAEEEARERAEEEAEAREKAARAAAREAARAEKARRKAAERAAEEARERAEAEAEARREAEEEARERAEEEAEAREKAARAAAREAARAEKARRKAAERAAEEARERAEAEAEAREKAARAAAREAARAEKARRKAAARAARAAARAEKRARRIREGGWWGRVLNALGL